MYSQGFQVFSSGMPILRSPKSVQRTLYTHYLENPNWSSPLGRQHRENKRAPKEGVGNAFIHLKIS